MNPKSLNPVFYYSVYDDEMKITIEIKGETDKKCSKCKKNPAVMMVYQQRKYTDLWPRKLKYLCNGCNAFGKI